MCNHTYEHNCLNVHLCYRFIISSPVVVQYVAIWLPQVTGQWLPRGPWVSSSSGQNHFPMRERERERGERGKNTGLQLLAVTLPCGTIGVLSCLKFCTVFKLYVRAAFFHFILFYFLTRGRLRKGGPASSVKLPDVYPQFHQWIMTVVLHYTSIMFTSRPKKKSKQKCGGNCLFGLGWFPQVVSLISCFPAPEQRVQSLSVSLEHITMPGMAAFVQYDH